MKLTIGQLEMRIAPTRGDLWDFVANLCASSAAVSSDAGASSIIQATGDTVVTSDGHSQQAVVVPEGSTVVVSTPDNGHSQAVIVSDGQSTVVTGSGGNSAVVVGGGSASVATQGQGQQAIVSNGGHSVLVSNWGHHHWFHRVW